MESAVCIFSVGKGECSGRKNSHLNFLMCGTHLRDYYGLEIHHSYIEAPTEVAYIGWTLKPVSGMFFKENDIIVPMREIIDKTYRPDVKVPTEDELKYRINTRLDEFMRRASQDERINQYDRYTYELIRNLSETLDHMNVNPTEQCEKNPRPVAYLRSKMTISETYLQRPAFMNHITATSVLTNNLPGAPTEQALDTLEDVSLSYRYMLSKFEYSMHVAQDLGGSNVEVQRIKPNAVFIPKVGVVAVTDIADPETIIVFGVTRGKHQAGNTGYYDEIVTTYGKEIIHNKLAANRIPNQSTRLALKSHCIQ